MERRQARSSASSPLACLLFSSPTHSDCTDSTASQPSAPTEAELYYGTTDNPEDNVPLAAAIPIDPETPSVRVEATASVPTQSVAAENAQPLTGLSLGPAQVTCPFCHQNVRTNTSHVIDLFTLLAVGIVFLIFWPLCWLPLVIPGCKVTQHFCPRCHRKVSVSCYGTCVVLCWNDALIMLAGRQGNSIG